MTKIMSALATPHTTRTRHGAASERAWILFLLSERFSLESFQTYTGVAVIAQNKPLPYVLSPTSPNGDI